MRKVATLETLLSRHWDDRVIVFAKSVEEVYSLSRRFLIPASPTRPRPESGRRSWTASGRAATAPSSPPTS